MIEHAPPRRREVLIAGLRRLAVHPRQSVGRWHYLELCAKYLHTMTDGCYETARRTWHEMRSAVGWWQVGHQRAEAMGARLRPLGRGQRHGQHVLIPPEYTAAFRQLARDLGVLDDTADDRLTWTEVEPRRKGSRFVCRCPFHDDRRPSMLLDPTRRRATCLACGTVHRLDPSAWTVSSPVDPSIRRVPPAALPSGSIGYRTTGWLVGRIGIRGLQCRPTDGDLFDAMQDADQRARRARVPIMAQHLPNHRSEAPELVAHVEQVQAVGWKQHRGRWRPTTHRPTAVRFLLVDIDDIDFFPLDRGESLADVGATAERYAGEAPELSGRVSVVHTSLHGVQVLFELAEPQAPEWRRSPAASDLHDQIDAVVLDALERAGYLGGHADRAARGLGRLCRLPGPRVTKQRHPWIARLRYLTGA